MNTLTAHPITQQPQQQQTRQASNHAAPAHPLPTTAVVIHALSPFLTSTGKSTFPSTRSEVQTNKRNKRAHRTDGRTNVLGFPGIGAPVRHGHDGDMCDVGDACQCLAAKPIRLPTQPHNHSPPERTASQDTSLEWRWMNECQRINHTRRWRRVGGLKGGFFRKKPLTHKQTWICSRSSNARNLDVVNRSQTMPRSPFLMP